MKIASQILAHQRVQSVSLIHPAYYSTKKKSKKIIKSVIKVDSPEHLLPLLLSRVQKKQSQPHIDKVVKHSSSFTSVGPVSQFRSKGRCQQIGRMIRHGRSQGGRIKSNIYEQFKRLAQDSRDYLEFYFKKYGQQFKDLFDRQDLGKFVILTILKSSNSVFKHNCPQIVNRLLLTFQINPLNDFHRIYWRRFYQFQQFTRGTSSKYQTIRFISRFFLQSKNYISLREFKLILKFLTRKVENKLRKQQSSIYRLIEQAVEEMVSYKAECQPRINGQFFYELFAIRALLKEEDIVSLIIDSF